MVAIAFLRHIRYCSYYRVGLGVVQMVRYFKTSQIIRVIVPPKRTFQVRTAVTHTKLMSHKMYHMYVHLLPKKKEKKERRTLF